ncbi:MAG: tRNA (adenosine(37)-N6)-dimethylallyltransferase MiaA, partial [Gemmatimonadetes bacterium]|nr:tRNA (adenosine(37)-N6)-dimethylallyltransferase MiaA [Gemmatimonadota bacterium]
MTSTAGQPSFASVSTSWGRSSAGRSRPLEGAGLASFLAITGPTGAGKTALSLHVARALGGEIISMDSRQIYRGMDIGTAKATPEQRAEVPHHGIDIADPGERYSAGAFGRDARRWIAAIRARGRVPLLVGGTGFFLKAVTEPLFAQPDLDGERRAAVESALAGLPRTELARWVRALDPQRAGVAIAGGRQRMTRTVLIALLTGRPLSWWHSRRNAEAEPLEGVVCVVAVPREVLDERIGRRVRAM